MDPAIPSVPKLKTHAPAGNQKLAVDEPVPLPKRQRRAGYRITVEGTAFILFALLIGLAAVNTGANLLYLIVAIMLAMLIFSGVLARMNLRGLTFERRYPVEFHAGQQIEATVHLMNRKRLFRSYALRFRDSLSGPVDSPRQPAEYTVEAVAMAVAPGQSLDLHVHLRLPERGLFRLDQAQILSRYPFGFFERAARFRSADTVLAYPSLLPIEAILPHCPGGLGLVESTRRGSGVSLYGVRDYQSTDPARFIHWKHSAKGQGFKFKEFEQEESTSFLLMLDLRCPDPPPAALLEAFEKAVRVAATLASWLARKEVRVGLWTSRGHVSPATGLGHLQRILRALAQVEPQPPDARPVALTNGDAGATELWIDYMPP